MLDWAFDSAFAVASVAGLVAVIVVLASRARRKAWPDEPSARVSWLSPGSALVMHHEPMDSAPAGSRRTAAAVTGTGAGLNDAGLYGVITGSVPGAGHMAAIGPGLRAAGMLIAVVAVPAVFPDGKLPGPRWRWLGWSTVTAVSRRAAICARRRSPGRSGPAGALAGPA